MLKMQVKFTVLVLWNRLLFACITILQTYNSHLAVLEAKREEKVMILILILVLTSVALQWKSQKWFQSKCLFVYFVRANYFEYCRLFLVFSTHVCSLFKVSVGCEQIVGFYIHHGCEMRVMVHFLYNTMAYDMCHVIAHTALNKSFSMPNKSYHDSPCLI